MTATTNFLSGTSNADYHANTTHLSSSALKLILKDPAAYHWEYILGNKTESNNPAFLDGTLVHSLILEPELVTKQYSIYEGLRRQGKAYEEFCATNPSTTVVTAAQMVRAEKLYQSFASLGPANALVQGGFSEHSMVGAILGVPVKCRADYINVAQGYIADVKTTSAPTDIDCFKDTVAQYCYDLSAALYCDIAAQTYGKLFEFYFIVLSKADGGCAVYKASSETLTQGASGVTMALVQYKKCMASGIWQREQPAQDFSTDAYEILEV